MKFINLNVIAHRYFLHCTWLSDLSTNQCFHFKEYSIYSPNFNCTHIGHRNVDSSNSAALTLAFSISRLLKKLIYSQLSRLSRIHQRHLKCCIFLGEKTSTGILSLISKVSDKMWHLTLVFLSLIFIHDWSLLMKFLLIVLGPWHL